MISGRRGMIAVMMLHASGGAVAVPNHVGMRHAVGRGLAVAESKHRGWRHEAKRREGREQNRKPEGNPGGECCQHEFVINSPRPDLRLMMIPPQLSARPQA